MTMTVRLLGAAIAALSLAGLSACASTPVEPSPSSAPSSAASESPSAPAEETIDLDDPSTWIISGAGIGPVVRGAAVPTAAGALGPYVRNADTQCPNPGALFFESGPSNPPLLAVAEDGETEAQWVSVSSWGTEPRTEQSPQTETGIRLGATLAETQSAYPELELSREKDGSNLYAVEDGDGWVVFNVQNDVIVAITASPTNTTPSEYCG